MIINQEIMISVAEPWDFTSPEGDNKFSGVVEKKAIFNEAINKINPKFEEAFLIKVSIPFVSHGYTVNYVVAKYRYNGDKEHFNFHYIPDQYVSQFINLDDIIDKLKLIIIGSVIG